jgi:hypothetical protein
MKALFTTRLALAVGLLMLAGCSQSPVNAPGAARDGTSMDQTEVASAVASSPEVVEDNAFESNDPATIDGGATGTAAIHPLRYWRTIRSVDRSFEFAFADTDSTGHPTTAVVIIRKRLLGRFNILVGEPGTDGTLIDSALSVVRKPLEDHWVRRLLLKRVRVDDQLRPVWRIVATSGVQVTARDATTKLMSLRVQSGDVDTTITDPARFFYLRRILKFDAGAQVTLTATTLRADDIVVLQLRDHRLRFHSNGDNTYTGTWTVDAFAGLRHFGVNALSHGTLFDDTAPYDSQAWLLPFLVRPSEIAALLP